MYTRSDIICYTGPCDKIHNDRLKERYQSAPDKHKYPYEAEFYDYLNKLVNDLGRRIRNGKGRLNIQGEDKVILSHIGSMADVLTCYSIAVS